MSKVGFHKIIGPSNGYGDALKRCALAGQPVRVIKCVDDFSGATEAKQESQDTITVGRLNKARDEHGAKFDLSGMDGRAVAAGSPSNINISMVRADAEWYYSIVKPVWDINSQIDYWECFNEWSFHWEYQALFYIEMMDIVERDRYKLALFGCSVGNPPEHTYPAIAQATARAREFGGHVLSLHEYGLGSITNTQALTLKGVPLAHALVTQHNIQSVLTQARAAGKDLLSIPTLKGTQPFLALRYRTLHKYLKDNQAECDIIITECGQAGGFDFIGTQPLVDDLAWYDSEMQKDSYLLGATQFTLGKWFQSNFQDALPALADYIIANPGTGPSEPDMPIPSECKPRTPYNRRYHWIDINASEEVKNKVWEIAKESGGTVGSSADDALFGPNLKSVTGIFYNVPPEEEADFETFRDKDYPDSFVEFITLPDLDPIPPPTTGKPLVGISIAIDGRHTTELGYEALKVIKPDTIKISTLSSFEEMDRLATIVPDVSKWTMRLYMAGDSDQLAIPFKFYDPQKAHIDKFRSMGGRDLEIHNEPNHPNEGMGTAWNDSFEFIEWYNQVVGFIRNDYPTMAVGFPGLWPNESVDVWLNSIGNEIALSSDIIYIHTYWQQRGVGLFGMANPTSGGRYWERFYKRFPKHRLIISECSNNHPSLSGVSYSTRGHELLDYMTGDNWPRNMESIFPYILELDGGQHIEQQWATPNNPIPSIIGGRK